MKRWRKATLLVATTVSVSMIGATAAFAAFSSTNATAATTVSTYRTFPGTRTTSAWDVRDASAGGAETNFTDATTAVDARLVTSSALTTAFSATRYVDVLFNAPMPGGLGVSGATLNISFAESGGGSTCIYFEMRVASTNAVLGTHGSSGTPLACNATTTQAASATSIPEVTTTTLSNDLKVRIFARNSVSQKLTLDRVTMSGTAYSAFSLFESSIIDSSNGTPVTTPWGLTGSATTFYTSASAWATSFSSTRYLKVTFPAYVPTGATITGASIRHTYSSAASGTTCYWFEVYNGTTLLAAHGSTTTPVSCNSTTTFATDTISLPEITTVAAANNVVIKAYVRSSTLDKSRHDAALLDITYKLV
jgi:hypothetical protein